MIQFLSEYLSTKSFIDKNTRLFFFPKRTIVIFFSPMKLRAESLSTTALLFYD